MNSRTRPKRSPIRRERDEMVGSENEMGPSAWTSQNFLFPIVRLEEREGFNDVTPTPVYIPSSSRFDPPHAQ